MCFRSRSSADDPRGDRHEQVAPRRWRFGLALAGCLALLALSSASPAGASFGYLTQWGGVGSSDGKFSDPTGVATDGAGNVYVADTSNNRVPKFTSAGKFLTKWGSEGIGDGQFRLPTGIATDAAGDVYVSDYSNNRVEKFTSAGTFLTAFDDQAGKSLTYPRFLATDLASNVYVVFGNTQIEKFTSAGTFLTGWGGQGSGNGQFSIATGIATDSTGNVFVVDSENHLVQKFTPSGTFLAQWGVHGGGAGQFYRPFGLAIDAAGNLYVSDSGNCLISEFTSSGAFISRFPGTAGFCAGALATDSAGNVYAVDLAGPADPGGGDRIEKFGPGGSNPASSSGSSSRSGSGSRCVVPNLQGKRRTAAKKALEKAGCALGKVKSKRKGGKVTRQNHKAGQVLPAGSKVNVTLA